jgi:hypothetical protein
MAEIEKSQLEVHDQEIVEFLGAYTHEIQKIALKLRELVFKVEPDVLEQIDFPGRLIGYGFARTYKDTICVIMPLKAGVNLGFPRGIDLPDPMGLLVGTGKRARHVRISSANEANQPALRDLLEASARLTRGTP